ncbi:MAG: Gldg family protein, partial [Myxococcales bacterium]|nr:Gldg family protein [Myxococcales bacterium]
MSKSGERLRRALAPDGRLSLALGLLLLAAILVMLNYIAARHYARGDLTPSGIYSLSDKAKAVLAALSRPLRITVFMVPPDRYRESLYHEVRELCARFAAASPRVAVELIDVDADAARAALLAKRYGITREDLRRGVVVFSSGKRTRHVRARELARYRAGKLVAFRGESALISALLSVTASAERRV